MEEEEEKNGCRALDEIIDKTSETTASMIGASIDANVGQHTGAFTVQPG